MTVRQAYDNFIYAKRLQGLSDMSIKNYQEIIGYVVSFLGDDMNICDITTKYVNSYIEYQLERTLSQSTFATYIRNARIFLMWIEKTYDVYFGAKEIKIPKTPKTVPYIYSDNDIALIFNSISYADDWLVFRDKSMIGLMLDSGIRQSEVCNLNVADIDFHSNIIKISGKGNKQRFVPLGSLTKRFIQQYLYLRPFDTKRLFLTVKGENITPTALKTLAYKLSKHFPFEFSCHKLRHNFATNYCIDQFGQYGKIDIYSLMILMGHENIKTTERYMHVAMQILASRQNISHLDKILA